MAALTDVSIQSGHLSAVSLMQQNPVVQPLLTDLYAITMAYAYWKSGKSTDNAAFDLFFRKNPFGGEFTIFAGLDDCLRFLSNFTFSESDIEYLKTILPSNIDEEFYEYLRQLTLKDLTVYAVDEGSVVFPRIPLLRVEGPLIVVQLLETTLLTLINYASLMTTNAARYRLAAGNEATLLELGLRRAQGPDGGMSASKYAYIGGFDGTSNVMAGKVFGIPVTGTHAHSFITAFIGLTELKNKRLCHRDTGEEKDLLELSIGWRDRLCTLFSVQVLESMDGELAAFITYGISYPNNFLILVDTYDMRKSGLINFCSVGLALNELGYRAVGIRIDSGDLAYLSIVARNYFMIISKEFNIPWFTNLVIYVSNDINEETILSLNEQGHQINGYGIGTHLVTCQRQPALGCVYKMVEINDHPRIKLSQDFEKITMPGRKEPYRLYGCTGYPLIDLMQKPVEPEPEVGKKVLCRHPFDKSKRCFVIPKKVERLLKVYWNNGQINMPLPTLREIKDTVKESVGNLRPDIKRTLNPTPYKVAVSDRLYNFVHDLWVECLPISELN